MPLTDLTNKTLIVIGGPTASGKTELSIKLAETFQTEIISADSRQCYIELNIGTAKPDSGQLQRVPHHFIDSHSIFSGFSAGAFAEQALEKLNAIFLERDVAVAVGGTGLYLKSLIHGLDSFPETQPEFRNAAKELYNQGGTSELIRFLDLHDPEFLSKVDRQNPARMMRAVEIILQTGKPFSSFTLKNKHTVPWRVKAYVPDLDRKILYARINRRVDQMMDYGLLYEVRSLDKFRPLTTLNTVGYTELFSYLDGKSTLEEAVDKIKQHTRNYAKRQITWFKNQGDFKFAPADEILADINSFLAS